MIQKGNKYNYKGGRILHKPTGYMFVLNKEHPRTDSKGYVREHILVYEQHHKCSVLPYGQIHHIDKNRQNNSSDNLILLSERDHYRIHHVDMSDRKCCECGSATTWINKNGSRNGLERK
jgi:hypothetical protein